MIRLHRVLERPHVVRPTDQEAVVVSPPRGEERPQLAGVAVDDHLDRLAERLAYLRPSLLMAEGRKQGNFRPGVDQFSDYRVGARVAGAQLDLRDAVFEHQHAFGGETRAARRQQVGRRIGVASGQPDRMGLAERGPVAPLQRDRLLARSGAAEFIMYDRDLGIVDDAKPGFPQSHAVIGLFVIGRREALVETAQPLEQRARRHQKRGGAIVDVPLKHELGGIGITAAPVTAARPVVPDDRAGLLQLAVG